MRLRKQRVGLCTQAMVAVLVVSQAIPAGAAPGDLTSVPAAVLGAEAPKARDIAAGDATVASATGALTYAYPIAVPPGRLGMQPKLALTYSSDAPIYGGIAAGWSLAIPEIARDTSESWLLQERASAALANKRFVSTLAGNRPLVPVTEPTGMPADAYATYRAQNDDSFDRYEKLSDGVGWRVRSASGLTHHFGEPSLAPASSETWAPLTRTVDGFGNTVTYRWAGTNIVQIRYTSNASAGLPDFASVDFVWDSTSCVNTMPVGAVQDERLGISRGGSRLSQIRVTAYDPGVPSAIRHTRQISLDYDAAATDCFAHHAPFRQLVGIQESAWSTTAPRVDLPAVRFGYNRLARTFDQVVPLSSQALQLSPPPAPLPQNLSWGYRQPPGASAGAWPTVEAMFLDFDGDGLADRIRSERDGEKCAFMWQKNLGNYQFDVERGPVRLPTLPWSAVGDERETCSLSAQFTLFTNRTPPQTPACENAGSYLAYRWLDMNGDGLLDLVAAVHHDRNWVDPDAVSWAYQRPPAVDFEPACSLPASSCVADAGCRPGVACLPGDAVYSCVADAERVPCNRLMARSIGPGGGGVDAACFDQCMSNHNLNSMCGSSTLDCWTHVEIHPDGTTVDGATGCQVPENVDDIVCGFAEGGNAAACQLACPDFDVPPDVPFCGGIAPQDRGGRYPWLIFDNQGGRLATVPRIIDQPIPLESDTGDSSYGAGSVASTRHGVQDLDGDGLLDGFVVAGPELADQYWYVFPGDETGALQTLPGTNTGHLWTVPPKAPVGGTQTAVLGVPVPGNPTPSQQLDLRGLSMVSDLTGDGVADLVWKHSPPPWSTDDPVDLFAGDGASGFEWMSDAANEPFGYRLDNPATHAAYLSRSSFHLEDAIPDGPQRYFFPSGKRIARARLVDLDHDGRLDLVHHRWLPDDRQGYIEIGNWEETARLQINGGAGFLMTDPMSSAHSGALLQASMAMPANGSVPAAQQYLWGATHDLADLDGDGLAESVQFSESGTRRILRDADRQPLRLLKTIDNGRGGVTSVTYAATTDGARVRQDPARGRVLPSPKWVVATVTTTDAWSANDTATTTYDYAFPVRTRDASGRWGFRGFERVTTTAPSGSRTVEDYGYDVDWSGRLVTTRTYAAESEDAANTAANVGDPALGHPSSIRETSWGRLTLLGGVVHTFHPMARSSWTCNAGQTEQDCRATNSGRLTVWPLWYAKGGQLWVSQGEYTMDGPTYGAKDRRTQELFTLYSDATTYRLRQASRWAFESIDGVPANDRLTDLATYTYDASGLHLQSSAQYLDAARPAVTSYGYAANGCGVVVRTRRPNQQPAGPERISGFDSTYRFAISETSEAPDAQSAPLVVDSAYEPGTGAKLWSQGPNRVGANSEQRWTDVDGLGRPIATYVNRAVTGQTAWVKTQVGRVTYVDSVVGGIPARVVAENLIDYDGTRWTWEESRLDGRGRPIRVQVATGAGQPPATTTYDYDHRGQLTSITQPDPSAPVGSTATVTYSHGFDSLGRPTSVQRPAIGGAPSGTLVTYDGLVTRQEEVAGGQGGPAGRKILIKDAHGRLVEVRELVAGTDYASTFYTYDARDLVARIQNPDGVVTELTHDFAGHRIRIDRAGRTWTFGYDLNGNLITETFPRPAATAALEYTNSYTFDALDRVRSRSLGGRELPQADKDVLGIGTITFAYDACTNGVGRLCTATMPGSPAVLTASYTYDAEGHAASQTRQFAIAGVTGTRTASAIFGPGGRVVEQTYADNAVHGGGQTRARFTYDDRALPATVAWQTPRTTDAPRTVAQQVRNVAGVVLTRTANLAATPGTTGWRNFTSSWGYDALGRVTSQHVTDSTGLQHARQVLTYHGLGDPRTLEQQLGSTSGPLYHFEYGYDARHQLTSALEAQGRFTSSYAFTPAGKLQRATVGGVPQTGGTVTNRDVTYAYASPDPDAPSALISVAGGANLRSYRYDTVGNLLDRRHGAPTADPTDTFLYDGDNQLRRSVKYDGATVMGREDYYYDHAGERAAVVTRTAAGTVANVRVFLGDTEVELSNVGAVNRAYAYLSLGTPVARIVAPFGGWQTTSNTTSGTSIELTYQGLGDNAIASVSASGVLMAGFVYGPYGEIIQHTGNATALTNTRRRFNDKFKDDLTGLQYYGARYYDGLLLGWTQADPLYSLEPDSAWTEPRRANLYTFSLNNPLRYLDPDGRDVLVYREPTVSQVGDHVLVTAKCGKKEECTTDYTAVIEGRVRTHEDPVLAKLGVKTKDSLYINWQVSTGAGAPVVTQTYKVWRQTLSASGAVLHDDHLGGGTDTQTQLESEKNGRRGVNITYSISAGGPLVTTWGLSHTRSSETSSEATGSLAKSVLGGKLAGKMVSGSGVTETFSRTQYPTWAAGGAVMFTFVPPKPARRTPPTPPKPKACDCRP